MKKLTLFLILLIMVLGQGNVYAVESSSAATLGSESSPSGSVLEKLNQLKSEIASKAAEIKAEIGRKIENRAWNGSVISKSESEMVINNGVEDRRIRINEYTLYTTGKIRDKGALKDLVVGDFIVAIGDVDDKQVLIAKKILRVKKVVINKSVIWGQILNSANGLISLRTLSGNKDVHTDSGTEFWLGNKEASIQDAKKDKFLLTVIEGSSSAKLAADMIYFIPTTGFFKPEKIASPSAKVASPSAKVATPIKKK